MTPFDKGLRGFEADFLLGARGAANLLLAVLLNLLMTLLLSKSLGLSEGFISDVLPAKPVPGRVIFIDPMKFCLYSLDFPLSSISDPFVIRLVLMFFVV